MGRLPGVGRLLWLFLFYEIAFFVYPSVWAYFTRARFGWEPGMVGLSLAAFGLSIAVVQGGLIRIILSRLGERRTIIYGLWFNVAAFLAFAFVTSGTLALILTPLTAIGVIVTPALQGMMSRIAPDDAQGELQGVLTSVAAVATIVSPLVMTQIFAVFTRPGATIVLPGAPFLLSMALMLDCIVIFVARPLRQTA